MFLLKLFVIKRLLSYICMVWLWLCWGCLLHIPNARKFSWKNSGARFLLVFAPVNTLVPRLTSAVGRREVSLKMPSAEGGSEKIGVLGVTLWIYLLMKTWRPLGLGLGLEGSYYYQREMPKSLFWIKLCVLTPRKMQCANHTVKLRASFLFHLAANLFNWRSRQERRGEKKKGNKSKLLFIF